MGQTNAAEPTAQLTHWRDLQMWERAEPLAGAYEPSAVTWWRAMRDRGHWIEAEDLIATRRMVQGWYGYHLEALLAAGKSPVAARRALSRRGIYSRVP